MKKGGSPLDRLAEPAGMLGGPESVGERSESARRWDREHQPTSYRLDPAVPEQVREIQAWYKEKGYTVTLGQLVEDLLLYAFGAWERGEVEINVQEMRPVLRAIRRE